MFTGLVQAVGVIRTIEPTGSGRRLVIDTSAWRHKPAPGESISVAGCCLTVAAEGAPGLLQFDVVPETLARTTLGARRPGDSVNLEHAARADTLLGGHIVQGHIDAVGEVDRIDTARGEWRVRIAAEPGVLRLIPPKGSVAVEGVSLTVAATAGAWFEVALIPVTLDATTLRDLTPGAGVNIETDILARTVAHWLSNQYETDI